MTGTEGRRDELLAVVFDSVHEILPTVDPVRLRADLHLRDLGADSVDRVEIIVTVLDRLGLDEPMASFTDLSDIGDMVDLLSRRTAS